VKVLELRFLHRDARMLFKNKWRDSLRPGPNVRDGEIPGLEMTLNPHTGVITIDAPGDSTAVHLSAVSPKLEPAIAAAEFRPEPVAEVPTTQAPRVMKQRQATEEELGFDPNGDDIDDAEVARLIQGKGAKAALKKRGRKPKPKLAPAPEPVIEDDYSDEDGYVDEGDE
jgi:hypothetical protein